jgi:hypothetical protein
MRLLSLMAVALLGICILGSNPLQGAEPSPAADIEVPLWSGKAPGSLGDEPKDQPKITVRLPESAATGGCRMELGVIDTLSGKVASATLPLELLQPLAAR